MKWLGELNEAQRRAAEADDGPLCIIAGPGTGKTKTLTARIAYLIAANKAKPGQILALTFTKKAAEEMRERVKALLTDFAGISPVSAKPKIATFHALCHDLLEDKRPFASDVQRLQIIKSLTKPKELKSVSTRELGLLISRAKNSVEAAEPEIAKLVRAYNKALTEQDLRDFDDLLLDVYSLLKGDEKARKAVQERFHYILVDEFQDTNRLQYELLKLLRGHDNLFIIGDPNQSIYGFRGASGTIFEQFKADFPTARTIVLTANYRSVPEVVGLSNALFPEASDLEAQSVTAGQVRAVQVLNEYGEANWVLAQIQQAIGGGDLLKVVSDDDRAAQRRLSDFAVLYRSRTAAMTFQKLLGESGLPFQVVGDGSPYDQPHIQAIIALLRAAENGGLVEIEGFSDQQRRLLEQELLNPEYTEPMALAERLISILGFNLTRELQQFLSVLVRFKDIRSALRYFDVIAEQGFYDPKADAITLLTIHAAKGLEFPSVFVIGAEEGILPGSRGELDEERRLLYVAATRARDYLEIVYAKNRSGQPAEASRFIRELPPHILPRHADPDMEDQVRRIALRAAKRSQQSLF
jgi:DNA helicase-2/ATP-dependent DNA helicase PcrA